MLLVHGIICDGSQRQWRLGQQNSYMVKGNACCLHPLLIQEHSVMHMPRSGCTATACWAGAIPATAAVWWHNTLPQTWWRCCCAVVLTQGPDAGWQQVLHGQVNSP
jgi:hypothetical protein